MNTPENSQPATLTFVGGGTTGETAAGFLDAVEAGLVPGFEKTDVSVNAIVGSHDSGSRTGDLRKWYRLHAVGDFRRTISALGDSYAAPFFEQRFSEETTLEDVAKTGEQLLTALSYRDTAVSADRAQEVIENAIMMARDVTENRETDLKGFTLGHFVLASLMKEHRSRYDGSNVQTALDEASTLMATRGRVIADSLVPHDLVMQDGSRVIYDEHVIDDHVIQNPDNIKLRVEPSDSQSVISVPANPAALEAIAQSEAVVVGPGSNYTSNIPPFLMEGMKQAMQQGEENGQEFIFIGNLAKEGTLAPAMTGEHVVKELEKYAGRMCTRIVYNRDASSLPEGAEPLIFNRDELERLGNYTIIDADLVGGTKTYDRNNTYPHRSKVRTNMAAAAIAALANKPGELLAA